MADMIPPSLTRATQSEKAIFNLLKQLGDDCIIYHEPRVGDRHPDFIVIMPDAGVLVIEVKGWRLGDILRADSKTVLHKSFGAEKHDPHPCEQARGYMNRLRDECSRHKWSATLLQDGGAYHGRFKFPFCYLAFYTRISRAEIEERETFSQVFPADRNLMKEDLAALTDLHGDALKARLKSWIRPAWPYTMSKLEIDILRAVIHPVAVINTPLKDDASDIRVLDLAQERLARFLPAGHQIIYGVAGSGKTVILTARAKVLAQDASMRVLILCYNNLLCKHIRTRTKSFSNISVYTFNGWALKNRLDRIENETLEAHAPRLLDHFVNGKAADRGQFDAVLIDEAQLLPRDWIKCATLALKDPSPETASLLIVGDGTQYVFRKRPYSWADAGVAGRGRTQILKTNYRNTQQILGAAYPLVAGNQRGDSDGPGAPTAVPQCLRRGPEPEIVTLPSRSAECDYAAALIQSWLLGGTAIRGRREPVRPADIAVIHPGLGGLDPEMLASKLRRFTHVNLLKDHTDQPERDGVRIVTMQRVTGLQFRLVIVLWADLLSGKTALRDDRALLYMAMTRAEDVLVILHSGPSELVDQISDALSARAD